VWYLKNSRPRVSFLLERSWTLHRFLNGLGVADASLVLTTDAVLMRVVGMLQTLHCVAVSAHHITA
jgi:hypothetical protein